MVKKAKDNARFGSRYGTKIRKRVTKVEKKYKYVKQICPYCGEKKVKRLSTGIYECSNCGKKFAGGAYEPETLARRVLNKLYDKYGKSIKSKVSEKEIKEIEKIENMDEGE